MTLARMTRGTTSATVSVDMAVAEEAAATRIAGLVGTMKDAMMKDAMTTGVTMNAAMTNGGTEVDEGVVGRTPEVPACLGPFDSVHNPLDRRLAFDTIFTFQSSVCISQPSVDDPSTFSISKLNVQPSVVPASTLIILITKSDHDLCILSLKTRPRHRYCSTVFFSLGS